jgi:spore germination protein GerM
VTNDDDVPFALLDASAPPLVPSSPSGAAAQPVTLCFVRDGRLVVTARSLAAPVSLESALHALAAPPTDAGPLLRMALTDASLLRTVKLAAGVAQVDLQAAISQLTGEEQLLAVAQMVCTLTARPGVGQVSFTLDGSLLAVPKGDGSLATSPVARDDYASLLVPT